MSEDIYRLGRMILAAFTVGVIAYLKYKQPELTVEEMVALAGVPASYIIVKGTGFVK